MIGYVTVYGNLSDSGAEHIWKRRLTKGLWRSLCGLLSDGSSLRSNYDAEPCELCERIQAAIDKQREDEEKHDQH